MLQHPGQAAVVGGRRRQAHEAEARFQGRQAQHLVFLGRNIHGDQAVYASLAGVRQEPFDAIGVDGVVVAHQHQRGGGVRFAKAAHQIEGLGQSDPGSQRPQGGALDGWAVGHGVGERHSQFDHVRASAGQRPHDFQRDLGGWVARRHKGDKPSPAFAFQAGEPRVNAGGARDGVHGVLTIRPPGPPRR